ncbi:MAG: AI-2E family transporter [Synergistaceae bacterium]|jgi:predicted PurR-regulated permease PerM|nr:AI-2E family transporter [Synergistaceae bacterium]
MNISDDTKNVLKMKNSAMPFVLLLCLFVILSGIVIRPLAPALSWAAVLSFFTYPVYCFIAQKILRGRYSYLAAGINTALIILLLVLPMIFAGFTITKEAGRLYMFLINNFPENGLTFDQILSIPKLGSFISSHPDFFALPLWGELFSNGSRVLASFLARVSREMVGNAFKLGVNLIVIMVASFFITHDGHIAIRFMRDILPLSDASKDAFFIRCKRMLYAIFYGIMLTAGIQGTLGAIGWRFVGLPNSVVFGCIMFFLAMIPFVGTPLIWGPGALYLFLKGDTTSAILLLIWGVTLVSGIDNFLRPLFISEGSKAHVLMVFIGIIGGLSTWGFLGLFLGPMILSLSYFLLHIYRYVINQDREEAD